MFKNIRVLRVDPQIQSTQGLFCLLLPGAGLAYPSLREIQCGGRYLDSLIDLADARFQAGHRLVFAQLRCLRKADLRELVEEALIEGKVT